MFAAPHNAPTTHRLFRTTLLVAELTLRLWIHSMFQGLGSVKKTVALLASGSFLLIAYTVLGIIFFRTQLPLTAAQNLASAAPLLTFLLMTLSVFLTVLCFIYAPPASHVMVFLSVFALKNSHIRQVLSWLALGLGIAFTTVFTFPLIFNVMAAAPDILTASGCLLYSLAIITLCALGTHVLLHALTSIPLLFARRSSLPVRGIAALLTAVSLTYFTLQAVPFSPSHQPHGPAVFYGDILSAILNAQPLHAYQWAALILPALFLIPCGLLLGRYQRRADYLGMPMRRTFRFSVHFCREENTCRHASLSLLETKQWLRFPSNTVNIFFLAGISCFFIFTRLFSAGGEDLLGVNMVIVMLFGTIGVSFYGVTKPYHWLYRTFRTHTSSPWGSAKLCAAALIWLILTSLYAVPMLTSGGISATGFFFLLPTLLLELVTGLTVGLFFLASKEQAFGTTFSEGIATLAIVFTSIGVENTLASLEEPIVILSTKYGILACAVIFYYYTVYIRNKQNCVDNQ